MPLALAELLQGSRADKEGPVKQESALAGDASEDGIGKEAKAKAKPQAKPKGKAKAKPKAARCAASAGTSGAASGVGASEGDSDAKAGLASEQAPKAKAQAKKGSKGLATPEVPSTPKAPAPEPKAAARVTPPPSPTPSTQGSLAVGRATAEVKSALDGAAQSALDPSERRRLRM
eukprot:8959978-Alexandrium_andersonii.AAC.1